MPPTDSTLDDNTSSGFTLGDDGASKLSPEDHHDRGIALLQTGYVHEAVAHLKMAYSHSVDNAQYKSVYGLALAIANDDFETAIQLAESAARQEPNNPRLFVNLAKIYVAMNSRLSAVRYLHRALALDSTDEEAREMLEKQGVRKRPPLPFLSRGHLFNRVLGKMRARMKARAEQ